MGAAVLAASMPVAKSFLSNYNTGVTDIDMPVIRAFLSNKY